MTYLENVKPSRLAPIVAAFRKRFSSQECSDPLGEPTLDWLKSENLMLRNIIKEQRRRIEWLESVVNALGDDE